MRAADLWALELCIRQWGDYGGGRISSLLCRSRRTFRWLRGADCTDDAEAIEKAKRLVHGYAIELWSGDRLVTRLEAKTK
jgi:hypothetical protein